MWRMLEPCSVPSWWPCLRLLLLTLTCFSLELSKELFFYRKTPKQKRETTQEAKGLVELWSLGPASDMKRTHSQKIKRWKIYQVNIDHKKVTMAVLRWIEEYMSVTNYQIACNLKERFWLIVSVGSVRGYQVLRQEWCGESSSHHDHQETGKIHLPGLLPIKCLFRPAPILCSAVHYEFVNAQIHWQVRPACNAVIFQKPYL